MKIALVIDIGNGTWRDLQSPQTIYVPLAEIEAE